MNVLQLGLVDYETALKLQQSLVELRKQDRIADTLLLLEHPPVITLGRNARAANRHRYGQFLLQRHQPLASPFNCGGGGKHGEGLHTCE